MAYTNAQNKVVSDQIYLGVQEQSKFPFFANTKWSAEAANAKQVSIVNVGDVTIANYTAYTDMTPTQGSPSATVLAIDTFKSFFVTLDQTERLVGDQLNALATKATVKCALTADAAMLALATKANFATNWYAGSADAAVSTNTANVLDIIDTLGENLDAANVPENDRFIIAPPKLNTKIQRAMKESGLSLMPVENVLLKRPGSYSIGGFTVITSNQYVPITGSGTYDYKIFYGSANAVAAAYLSPVVESGKVEKQFADYVKGLFSFGMKVLDETQGGAAYLNIVADS